MSFKSKIDFCGLADGQSILVKSHTEGATNSVTECANDEGDVVDTTEYGHLIDPSNDYAIKSDISSLSVVLGGVNTVNLSALGLGEKHFVLKQVTLGTSNSGEVTLAAQSEEAPYATPSRTYTVVVSNLRQRNKAQILNSLFSLNGENAHLQKANYTFSVSVNHTTVDGERVTWDVYGGKIVASVEAKQAGSELPEFSTDSQSTLHILSKDNSETRPDSDYSSVEAEITKYLSADAQ